MVEIKSEDDLGAWLKKLPQETEADQQRARQIAAGIAHRAAMRVSPLAWRWLHDFPDKKKRDVTECAILWPLLISGCEAGFSHTEIIADAARAAAYSAAYAADAAYAVGAAYAAYAAADAAYAAAYASYAAADAADAADASWWAVVQDCELIEKGEDCMAAPLWHDAKNPLANVWADLANDLSAAPADQGWRFWIDWYERALTGQPQDWPLLKQVAEIDETHWRAGPAAVWAQIQELLPKELGPDASAVVLNAALADFRLDQINQVMQFSPFADDLRHLDDPEQLRRFLRDAEDLRRSAGTLCEALSAGTGMQGAGQVVVYLQHIEQVMAQAEDTEALSIGLIIEYGALLEAYALDDTTRAEFGPLFTALGGCVDRLRRLVQDHFSRALVRMAPLDDLAEGDAPTPWETLAEVRQVLDSMRDAHKRGLAPMSPEVQAVLRDMANQIERQARAYDGASSDEARQSYQREINYRASQLLVTVKLFLVRTSQSGRSFGDAVDWLLKQVKRAKGVSDLLETLGKVLKDMGL